MIDYETYCRLRQLRQEQGLNTGQIARELSLHPETVAKYAGLENFPRRRSVKRASKLDPFKAQIARLLER